MKLIWGLIILSSFVFGQRAEVVNIIQPQYLTITLDSTATTTVYFVFPVPQGAGSPSTYQLSATAPTATNAAQTSYREFAGNGVLSISIIADVLTAEESDSLYAQVNALVYDPTWGWKITENDDRFLVFDTPGTYTQTTVDYLNWTTDLAYISELGGNMLPAAGIAIVFGQYANDQAGAATTLYISIWWQK